MIFLELLEDNTYKPSIQYQNWY